MGVSGFIFTIIYFTKNCRQVVCQRYVLVFLLCTYCKNSLNILLRLFLIRTLKHWKIHSTRKGGCFDSCQCSASGIPRQIYYRPQRSCGKVIFSQAYVSHSVHGGGGCLPLVPEGCVCHTHTSLSRHPPPQADTPGQTPPCPVHAGIHPQSSACWDTHTPLHSTCWDMVNKRAVRIPLECILVIMYSSIKQFLPRIRWGYLICYTSEF